MIGIEAYKGVVKPEWIDVNNHMNVAYYVLAFDYGVDTLWERFGLTEAHIAEKQTSTFAVESHITWQKEMNEADAYVITTQILAYDEKRIHQFMRMYHSSAGYIAATAEWLNLHVDLTERRVSPWPQIVLDRIARTAAGQTDLDWPDEVGRQMKVPAPLYDLREAG